MDLLLDRDKMDLVFVNGDCPTTSDLVDVVTQRLYIRLRTFYREWFLDVTYGVPYLESILGKKVSRSTVDMILQENIAQEEGVKEIIEFSSSLSLAPRNYICSFRVKVTDGQITDTITINEV